jgi:hypothetical protein
LLDPRWRTLGLRCSAALGECYGHGPTTVRGNMRTCVERDTLMFLHHLAAYMSGRENFFEAPLIREHEHELLLANHKVLVHMT